MFFYFIIFLPVSTKDPKVHTLTWGVSSKPNCSSLTPKKYVVVQ